MRHKGRRNGVACSSFLRGPALSLLLLYLFPSCSLASETTNLIGSSTSLPMDGVCMASCNDTAMNAITGFAECVEVCGTPQSNTVSKLIQAFVALVLVGFSGMFSGLTLGLLSLDIEGLDIIVNAGTEDERRWAQRILPLRRRGNLLLCTLLLGNTLVNAVISILTADLTSGIIGGLISTALIVIFGEIVPQAVCSRHGLRIGAASVIIVKPLMIAMLPVTLPIAAILDCALGDEISTSYNRQQLDKLLEMHVEEGVVAPESITTDEQHLMSSALHFSSKQIEEIMTPLEDVFMISVTDNLDFDDLKAIYVSGYTRIPVYHNRRDCIVGILYTKDLILVDPNDEIPVASILPFCSRAINAAPQGTTVQKLLAEMQSSRSHLYFVTDSSASSNPNPRRRLPRVEGVRGIVTMEDLIEELISIEIIDESDIVTDNISRRRLAFSKTQQRRIEFFEMLQRRELLTTERLLSNDSHIGGERPTNEEVRALASYLSNNVAAFRPSNMSFPLLRRLLLRCSISSVDEESVRVGRYVYVRGVKASFCCLVLHGRLQIRAGNEGFTSEIGPWTTLALGALTDENYSPDFTARVECAARILIITRLDMQQVLGISSPSGQRPVFGPSAGAGHSVRAGGGAATGEGGGMPKAASCGALDRSAATSAEYGIDEVPGALLGSSLLGVNADDDGMQLSPPSRALRRSHSGEKDESASRPLMLSRSADSSPVSERRSSGAENMSS